MAAGLQAQIVTHNAAAAELSAMLRWAKPHEQDIYRVAMALTGNLEDSDRVLMETVRQAWDKFIRRTRVQPSLLEVLQIAVSESTLILRAQAGDLAGWIEEPDSHLGEIGLSLNEWDETPARLFAPQEWKRIRQLALGSLTTLDRVVFILRDVLHFSESETAELIGRPAAAARIRLLRARLRLREWLNPLCRVTGAEAELAAAQV